MSFPKKITLEDEDGSTTITVLEAQELLGAQKLQAIFTKAKNCSLEVPGREAQGLLVFKF